LLEKEKLSTLWSQTKKWWSEKIKFWKMHGIGNDYIVIDNRSSVIKEKDASKLAQKICRRRYSIGADGMILVSNSTIADAKMQIFNLDGSEAEMCGNGIRCFSKYCYENNIVQKKELTIETLAGIRKAKLFDKNNKITQVSIDMGIPIFERNQIPMTGNGKCVNQDLTLDKTILKITCLSVGNPHCVLFVDNVDVFPVHIIGPKIENHPLFPNRTNVMFVEIQERDKIKMRSWERGCGETLACGTGACAAVVAGNFLGKTKRKVTVSLRGGELEIDLAEHVFMKGPVEKVFEGSFFLTGELL